MGTLIILAVCAVGTYALGQTKWGKEFMDNMP